MNSQVVECYHIIFITAQTCSEDYVFHQRVATALDESSHVMRTV